MQVVPEQDESLGHYLGQFRGANVLSHKAIADHLGVRVGWVKAWESPSLRRDLTNLQLLAFSKLVDVIECKAIGKKSGAEPCTFHLEHVNPDINHLIDDVKWTTDAVINRELI